MARMPRKRNNVQVGVTDEALTDFTILAAQIGRRIGLPRLSRATLATWAAHYLFAVSVEEARGIIACGRKVEAGYLADGAGLGGDGEGEDEGPRGDGQGGERHDRDAGSSQSVPVIRGGTSKATLGVPIPKLIKGRPKRRADQEEFLPEIV